MRCIEHLLRSLLWTLASLDATGKHNSPCDVHLMRPGPVVISDDSQC